MEKRNKYHYDLKNVHRAKGTKNDDGTVVYGPYKRMRGAISIDLSAEGEITKTRADGTDYIVVSSNNGYSGSVTFAQVDDDFKVDCLGEKIDELTGVQYEDSGAEPGIFALAFEFTGDVKARRFVLYGCTASRPGMVGENKENQKEPDTEEMELTASPIMFVVDGVEKNIVRASTTEETDPETYNAWYTQVVIPGKRIEKLAKLSNIQIGALKITPEFSPDITSYAASTTNATNTIKATPVDSGATLEIKLGSAVIKNGEGATWIEGENELSIKVTNGTASETYKVKVTKGA